MRLESLPQRGRRLVLQTVLITTAVASIAAVGAPGAEARTRRLRAVSHATRLARRPGVTPLSRLAVNSGTAVAAAPVAIPVFEVVGSGGLEAVVAVPAPAAVIGTPAPAAVSAPASATNDGAAMAAMVNSARAANGLAALKFDEQLTASGLQWSQDMAVNGFRHRDLSTLAQPTAHALGENIAQGTNVSVAKLHDALMNSTGHRENILSTTFTRIGIGVFRQGNALWITQEFAG